MSNTFNLHLYEALFTSFQNFILCATYVWKSLFHIRIQTKTNLQLSFRILEVEYFSVIRIEKFDLEKRSFHELFFPQRSRCHQLSCRITLLQTFKNKPDCSCAISVFIHNPADHVITSALNFANNTSLRYVLFKGSKYRQQKYQMETQL